MAQGGVTVPRMVRVVWRDAVAICEGWTARDEAIAERAHECETVGMVIKDGEHELTVALTVSGDQINGAKVIPKGWIKSVTELKPVRSGGSAGTGRTKRSRKAGGELGKPSPTIQDSLSS